MYFLPISVSSYRVSQRKTNISDSRAHSAGAQVKLTGLDYRLTADANSLIHLNRLTNPPNNLEATGGGQIYRCCNAGAVADRLR